MRPLTAWERDHSQPGNETTHSLGTRPLTAWERDYSQPGNETTHSLGTRPSHGAQILNNSETCLEMPGKMWSFYPTPLMPGKIVVV